MRLGLVVNEVASEQPVYTTVRLARAAALKGHEVWLTGVGDFGYRPDGTLTARARAPAHGRNESLEAFLGSIQSGEAREETISLRELDIVVLRNDPAVDVDARPWAVTSGVLFGQLAVADHVPVVNDPTNLANALNKTYFQQFPDAVRPCTLISRDPAEIADFVDDLGGDAVLKPLQGSGGSNVFFTTADGGRNLNQMIEAITRDGYAVAQEVLPEADEGDVRLFVMNGEPLRCGNAVAAFRRVNEGPDRRSNMHAGGKARPVELTDTMLGVVDLVRPKLRDDGMFLVGLDLVGDKLLEVNVFSPGGLGSCEALYGEDFAGAVVDALQHKVELIKELGDTVANPQLAVL